LLAGQVRRVGAQRHLHAGDGLGGVPVVGEVFRGDLHEEAVPGHIELIERWFTGQLTHAQLEQLLAALRVVRDAVRPEATSGV
jgi:hypothetical protein